MQWSPQQDAALAAVAEWLRDRSGPQVFYLAGFAGTGKTTLARHLAGGVKGKVLFGAFTGKAALVLQTKGCEGASTIHSMIYRLRNPSAQIPEWVLNEDGPVKDAALVVIDEVSMVGEDLGRDLLSFGKKVLVLGDPAQLPPVRGEGFFTARDPDFMLTEVHRQAADNPIIRLSMDIREGRGVSVGSYGSSSVITRGDLTSERVLAADQVIVGLNKTRRLYNGRIRELLGRSGPFTVKDRVICLKNRAQEGLLNGSMWEVRKVIKQTDDTTEMNVAPLDPGFGMAHVRVYTHHAFYRGEEQRLAWKERRSFHEFDFGSAITCHKAQGSQWDRVLVFDESAAFREHAARHLYTAVTRAADRVEIVI